MTQDPDYESQFVALLTEIQLPLTLYVRALMPGNNMANDVAQQASMKIWEKRQDYQLGTNFKAWAFSIARFEVLGFYKKSARDARLTFSSDLQDSITEELSNADTVKPIQTALRDCMSRLKPSDRQLLLHRYSSSGTLGEFAKSAGRSVGGLKVTLHRLRNKLLACIHRKMRGQEIAT